MTILFVFAITLLAAVLISDLADRSVLSTAAPILKQAKAGKIDMPRADHLFRLAAPCIVGSIVAHSSTDALAARWLERQPKEPPPRDPSVAASKSAKGAEGSIERPPTTRYEPRG